MKLLLPVCLFVLIPLIALLILAPLGDRAALSKALAAPVPTRGAPTVSTREPTPRPTEKPALTPTPVFAVPLTPAPATTPEEPVWLGDEGLGGDEGSAPLPELPPSVAPIGPDAADLSAQTHYIAENDARYRAFAAQNPWCSARLAVSLVNVDADYGFYNHVTQVPDPASPLVLCDKNHQLPQNYAPRELVTVGFTGEKLQAEAAAAYGRMGAALYMETGLTLHVVSGYRSYASQNSVYKRYAQRDGQAVADTYSARAGHSEHQTGLAVDITQKAPSGSLRKLRFEDTAQYAWLLENAYKYGFILRYPEGYTSVTGYLYEPWHWRYIGTEAAALMREGGFAVLEEYAGQLQ